MTRWFETFMRRAFLRPFSGQEQALHQMAGQVEAMRRQLYQLYEEIELALRALDLLGERVDAARQRVQLRVEAPEPPVVPLTPRTFTGQDRQREEMKRGVS